jgi:hypothetical protein
MADELLHVLSQRRELSWPAFRRFVEELADREEALSDGPSRATITLHALKALGHLSVSFADGAGRVAAAPRVLVRLPCLGEPTAVLTGHRLPDTEEQLRRACASLPRTGLISEDQDAEMPLLPRRLLVTARTTDQLAEIAHRAAARFTPEPAAWRLLQYACSLEEWLGRLDWGERKSPRWPHRCFDPQRLAFVDNGDPDGDGLHAFTEPDTGLAHYWLRRGLLAVRVDRDWGRWAVSRGRLSLGYTCTGEVAVPGGALLPGLFSCALATCSGFAPAYLLQVMSQCRPDLRGWLVYGGVPRLIAQGVADKLGQTLTLLNRKLLRGPSPCPT